MEPITDADKVFREFWIEDKGEEGECRQERVHVFMDALIQEAFMQGFQAAESDRDAGWDAAEKLCESLREIAKGFDDDGYLCNRDEVLKVVAWFDAARAKRNPNSEI